MYTRQDLLELQGGLLLFAVAVAVVVVGDTKAGAPPATTRFEGDFGEQT